VRIAWDVVVHYGEIEAAVNELSAQLKLGNTRALGESMRRARALEADQWKLLQMIDEVIASWEAVRVRLTNEIQFLYAGENVAPTRMGNIAGVAEFYAYSRYAMNLSIFWTRLQKSIQTDKEFYGSVQDAKRQLDF
jgi:hypothetical protein